MSHAFTSPAKCCGGGKKVGRFVFTSPAKRGSNHVSGGGRCGPWVAPCEHQVGGFDELSHDGDGDELLGLAGGGEPFGEGLEAGIEALGGDGGEVEHPAWSGPPAGDEALTFPLPGVAIEGCDAEKAGGLTSLHSAKVRHAD